MRVLVLQGITLVISYFWVKAKMLKILQFLCFWYMLVMEWKKEGNVLFGNPFNILFTFIMAVNIRLIPTLIMREEYHCHHIMGYSFQLAARDHIYTHPTDRLVHTALITMGIEDWLEWEIDLWVHQRNCSDSATHHEWTLYHWAMFCSYAGNVAEKIWGGRPFPYLPSLLLG